MSYYLQSVSGHLEIESKKQPISDLLDSEEIDSISREKLALVLQLKKFAALHLHLPENKSYSEYSDIGRDYVVWNVFAAPEFSLEPKQSCFLFVGCLSYRGYFSKSAAIQYAETLKAQNYDTYVGGVTAYSTLGWFNDPVLNTMLIRGDLYLANVIFHELAHQKLYIEDDSAFNEAFAEAVALAGVNLWLEIHDSEITKLEYAKQQEEKDFFIRLILKYKSLLEAVYGSDLTETEKRTKKSQLLTRLTQEYTAQYQSETKPGRYGLWLNSDLNNAKLTTVITYQNYVAGFLAILDAYDGDYEKFYEIVTQLSQCQPSQRNSILEQKITEFHC